MGSPCTAWDSFCFTNHCDRQHSWTAWSFLSPLSLSLTLRLSQVLLPLSLVRSAAVRGLHCALRVWWILVFFPWSLEALAWCSLKSGVTHWCSSQSGTILRFNPFANGLVKLWLHPSVTPRTQL